MKGNPVSLAANNLPRPGSIPSKDRDGARKWNAGNTDPLIFVLKVANSNKITNTNNVTDTNKVVHTNTVNIL